MRLVCPIDRDISTVALVWHWEDTLYNHPWLMLTSMLTNINGT